MEKEHICVTTGFVAVKTDLDERAYFIAAALTCGFNLAENSPQITNTYSKDDVYERGQSGDVRMLIEPRSKDGVPLPLLAKTWRDWDEPMNQATEIPRRIADADNDQKVMALISGSDDWPGIEWLVFASALVHMRLFSLGKIALPDNNPASDEEKEAVAIIDGITARISDPTKAMKRNRTDLAKSVASAWRPAMVCWVKAFTLNYIEIRDVWKEAPKSIKISRGEGRLPLVLPKGPNFARDLKAYT